MLCPLPCPDRISPEQWKPGTAYQVDFIVVDVVNHKMEGVEVGGLLCSPFVVLNVLSQDKEVMG